MKKILLAQWASGFFFDLSGPDLLYLGHCDLYVMVQLFCLILNTICWINVTPGILVPCDPMNDHLLYLGHCDLYFMLQ